MELCVFTYNHFVILCHSLFGANECRFDDINWIPMSWSTVIKSQVFGGDVNLAFALALIHSSLILNLLSFYHRDLQHLSCMFHPNVWEVTKIVIKIIYNLQRGNYIKMSKQIRHIISHVTSTKTHIYIHTEIHMVHTYMNNDTNIHNNINILYGIDFLSEVK